MRILARMIRRTLRLHRPKTSLALAFAALVGPALLPGTARAIEPNAALGSRPTFERFDGGDAVVRGLPRWDRPSRAVSPAYQAFLAEVGPGWRASFDAETGVPSRLYGPGLAAPNTVASPAAAEAFARDILSRHARLLAPFHTASGAPDFELVSNDLDGGMRTLGFVQRSGGMRVLGGQVSFRFKNDRLFMIGSEALPNVPSLAMPSSIDEDQAKKAAVEWVERDFGIADADPSLEAPVVVPRREGDRLVYRAAVPVVVTPRFVTAKYRVYVDAATYEPIARKQLYMFASANVLLHVPERAPTYGDRFDAPALLTNVTVEGSQIKTDTLGAVSWTGPGPTDISLTLNGDRARVFNDAGDEAVLAIPLSDATPFVWDASGDEQLDAQLTSFVHAGVVREYARTFAPVLPFLNQQVKATVNIDDICNAYSDGTTINFFLSGQGCANTGRIADVVYHEYGHSLHYHAIIEGVGAFDGALSEGQSDYVAATITGDPATARGFFQDDQPLRDLDPVDHENHWPEDLVGEEHEDGRIIAQALWDMRKNLVASLGPEAGVQKSNELYYQAIRRAVDIPSMYPEILAADDDDGDITNGTPNVCDINEAFERHGLRAIGTTKNDLGIVAPTVEGYAVTVQITGLFPSCPGDAIVGGELDWSQRDDAAASGVVALDVDGSTLTATIPSQPDETVVEYGIDVELDGRTLHLPDNEADPKYQMFVGEVTPLYCTDFETDPEADGWTHRLEQGADEEGADDWMWGEAHGTSQNGDPPEAFSGTHAFGNDLSPEAKLNGLYQPDKVNSASSPVVDLKGHKKVHLQYRRWLNVEDAHFDQATILGNGAEIWHNFDSDQGDNSDTQHTDREWRFHDVDLSSAVGPEGTMQVTFKIASDGGLELGGWTIDDFCIVALDAEGAPCDPADPACGGGGGSDVGGAGGGAGEEELDPEAQGGCTCTLSAKEQPSGFAPFALLALAPLLRRRRRI